MGANKIIGTMPKTLAILDSYNASLQVILTSADLGHIRGDSVIHLINEADAARKRGLVSTSGSGPFQRTYVAFLQSSQTSDTFEETLTSSTLQALNHASQRGMESAVINLGQASNYPISGEQAVDAVMQGIKKYFDAVDLSSEYERRISDVVISVGFQTYQSLVEQRGELSAWLLGQRGGGEAVPQLALVPCNGPHLEARAPEEIVLRWRAMVGRAFVAPSIEGDLKRNSPFVYTMSPQKLFVVEFDLSTGEPISITPGREMPEPHELADGHAAVGIMCFQEDGDSCMGLNGQMVMQSASEIPQRTMTILQALQNTELLIPQGKFNEKDLSDGAQLIMPDKDADAHNRAQVDSILSKSHWGAMTIMFNFAINMEAEVVLAKWLAAKTPGAREQFIERLIGERLRGATEINISVTENGMFVGGAVHQDAEHSPRGTTYEAGITATESMAMNVRFRSSADGKRVPVSYEWRGPEGIAKQAFLRWFNAPEFVTARQPMMSQEDLSRLMFDGKDPKERFELLTSFLYAQPRAMKKVQERHDQLGMDKRRSLRNFLKHSAKRLASSKKLSLEDELRVAYLEMIMRQSLGDHRGAVSASHGEMRRRATSGTR